METEGNTPLGAGSLVEGRSARSLRPAFEGRSTFPCDFAMNLAARLFKWNRNSVKTRAK